LPSNTETEYARVISREHRKKHGQFFTPSVIAEHMIQWLLDFEPSSIFDPAFGMGAFYIAHKKFKSRIPFFGTEIDEQAFTHWRNLNEKARIQLQDYFTAWQPNSQSAIVCNPPYMRFQNFANRQSVLEKIKSEFNIQVSGLMNIASAFLLKSIIELKPGGVLAYLMPLEFLNTEYGKTVKKTLLREGLIHSIYQIQCEKDAFPEVTTSVGILFFEKKLSPNHRVKFYKVDSIENLLDPKRLSPIFEIAQNLLDPSVKWLRYFSTEKIFLDKSSLCHLSTYGHFKRGIATGANGYFTVSSQKAKTLKLPIGTLIPCITKSTQIKKSLFKKSDFERMSKSHQNVYLVDLEKHLKNTNVKKYIELGVSSGVSNRYLTRTKNPWYKIEKRDVPSLFFGVFSKNKVKVIRNYSTAISLTCFHGFRPLKERSRYTDALLLFFHSKVGHKILAQNMRKYGEDLQKFEPNDLNACLVPTPDWFESHMPINLKKELSILDKNSALSERMENIFLSLLNQNNPKL
jgi:adenine-specific DNA-methyltransferase